MSIPQTPTTPRRLFITGIPTAGKSHLGRKLAEKTGGILVSIDDMRLGFSKDERFKDFVNFYHNQNETTYFKNTTCETRLQDLINQSAGLWPGILENIKEYKHYKQPVIYEGVSLLPYLVTTLKIPGVVLLGKSLDETLARIHHTPRWSLNDKHLQALEAEHFFFCERKFYQNEAEKYHLPTFATNNEAWETALALLT